MSIRMSLTRHCQRACAGLIGLVVLSGVASNNFTRPLCAQQPKSTAQNEAAEAKAEEKGPASSRRAIAYYSEAAGFQNKGAYELAIEQWKKLLDEFPEDPLASKGWHYMGICYTQLEEPNYAEAAIAFTHALKDDTLEVREESLINLAWCLFSQGRAATPSSPEYRQGLEQARARLSEFLKSYSTGSYIDQAFFYLGEIEYSLGNIDKSIPYYQKLLDTPAMQKSSLRAGALYAIAVAYEEAGKDGNAIKRFQQFLSEYPKNALAGEVSVRLSDILLKQGKTDEAAKLLAGVVEGEAGKMSDYARLRLGYAASTQGRNEEAIEHYTELLEQFPDSKHAPTAALSLGQCLYKSGLYDQALEKFSQVLPAKDAQAAEAAHWMAITLQRQNRSPEALKIAQEALEWGVDSPNTVNLLMDYADALYADPESLDKAREAYEKIAKEHPDDALAPRAAYNAAFAALQGGMLPEARQWAESFLNLYPHDPLRNDVTAIAAEVLLQQGEHATAATAYEKLRQADPQNPAIDRWTLRLGTAHYLAGDYADAVKLLTSEAARFKNSDQQAEAEFVLGASYLYQEQVAEAIAHLTNSHQANTAWSNADEVLLLLAEAHQRNKDNAAARKTLESLLEQYPNTRLKPQVEYKLAQLSAAMSQFDEAIRRYEGVVSSPDAASYHNFATFGIVLCLMQKEDYAQALERVQPLLAQRLRDSMGGEARLAEGVCLRKTGKEAQAIVALEEFLTTKPTGTSLASGLYELGLAYTQQGELSKATASFQRIVQEVPDYPALDKVIYEIAWNQQESGQVAEATKAFQQLVDRFPNSEFRAEATYMLAQQQYETQDYSRAAETYTSVLAGTQDPELREKTQYKLGWSLFQQQRYPQAAKEFAAQAQAFATGTLAVDAKFMLAECSFKQEQYEAALPAYQEARQAVESSGNSVASDQVKSLIYLHGAQCLRELARWQECEQWLSVVMEDYPKSPYLWTAVYELGYCKQKQEQPTEALKYYGQVVENNHNELSARARFMMGEVYFSQRDFKRAIEEFTRVAYGFGGDRAPDEIKNWQAKSAYEAARCYEMLASDLRGDSQNKAIAGARKFYEDIVNEHAQHELAKQASSRLGELQKALR